MYKLKTLFCILLNILLIQNIFSQYSNEFNRNTAPWITEGINPNSIKANPYSTAYAYKLIGTSSQLYRFNLGNPEAVTLIGSTQSYFFCNADFANPEGVWKFYAMDQSTAPHFIFEVDTATGNLTSIGSISNLKTGHKPRVMSWDITTGTMYVLSMNTAQTEMQLYSMYWPTKELFWIGPAFTVPGRVWAGAVNLNGSFFGIDNNSSSLWKVNILTGIWTQVGPLGVPASYFQGATFDKSNYSKMIWCGWSNNIGLYEVDTATGTAAFLGKFPWTTEPTLSVGIVPYFGPQIFHTPLQSTINLNGPYTVNAGIISSGSSISWTKLYWSRNSSAITDSLSMVNSGGNNWTGNIPGNGTVSTYRYYIKTADMLGRWAAAPFNAVDSLYLFKAELNDTIKPVISHTPLQNIEILQWPDSVIVSASDNNGIDSVWVRWNINSGSSKTFKLSGSSGNTYADLFNSSYADVKVGDTIHYRIIAQDHSLNHNRDSSALYSFNIIATPGFSCIGSGNVELGYSTPFNTFWKGFKSQMLYTASEISSSGGTEGSVLKLGFYVTRTNSYKMKRFNIKMQNTTLTQLNTGFINSDWTIVYSGEFTALSAGWQYIILQNPYYWDGISNLLIEICFGNEAESSTGTYVQGSPASSMYYYGYRDDTLACSVNPASTNGYSAKPNICFTIDPAVGIGIQNNAPASFSLHQNYPNPFNPVTKITYEIPEKGFVMLRIYDILGREIKTLVNEVKSKGTYSVDYYAEGIPSGIYLYRLECNNFISTKKMILIK